MQIEPKTGTKSLSKIRRVSSLNSFTCICEQRNFVCILIGKITVQTKFLLGRVAVYRNEQGNTFCRSTS